MSNDDYTWLQSYMQQDQYPNPLRYGDTPMPSFQGYSSPKLQQPPQPQPPYQNYVSPYSLVQQPPTQSSLQFHPPPYSQPYYQTPPVPPVQAQSYVRPSNIMHQVPPASTTQAPPMSNSAMPRRPPPTTGQASQAQNPIRLDSNTPERIPPPTNPPSHDIHDAKRRRITESSFSTPTSAPPGVYKPPTSQAPTPGGMPSFQKFSSYNYSPRDPTNKSGIKYRADIAERMNAMDAADKLTYDTSTIARDVLIAAGRHPTEHPLNHHLVRLRDVFPLLDIHADLETFRWDLVDQAAERATVTRDPAPTRAPAPSFGVVPPPTAPPPLPAVPVNKPTQQPQPPRPAVPVPPVQQKAPQPVIQVSSQSIHHKPNPTPPPPPVQRTPQHTPQPPPPKPQTTPQSRQKAPSQSPARSVTPTVQIPMVKMPGKRPPGRPPGSTNKVQKVQVAVPPPKVNYPVYACGWENCQAELHNLEMLKKHIYKSHVKYSITCSWKGCSLGQNLPAAELYKHIKKQHVDSIAWKLGDGPSLPGTGDTSTSASPGPFALPASNQPQGEDALIFPANYTSIRAFNRVHGNNTQYEKAREILKAVQRLKEHTGLGLDPGGCQLATPARNHRVSKEEESYDIVPGG